MPGFLAHNLKLLEEVSGWEARTRRLDLKADDNQLAQFYLDRLPAHMSSRKALAHWLETRAEHDRRLRMRWEHVTRDGLGPLERHLFPAQLTLPDGALALAYAFAPGTPDDGVTVTVPLAALPGLDEGQFERLVPGLLREKIYVLLKGQR
jgi:ATP-dependent helicase HrpA